MDLDPSQGDQAQPAHISLPYKGVLGVTLGPCCVFRLDSSVCYSNCRCSNTVLNFSQILSEDTERILSSGPEVFLNKWEVSRPTYGR